MESVAYWEVWKAVYALLNGVVTGGIYDEVPKGVSEPYTALGTLSDGPFNARGVNGRGVLLTLNIYSKNQGGSKQAMDIMKQIVEKMTATKLSMTNWAEVRKEYLSGPLESMKTEPEAAPYMGSVAFLIVVCKK